MTNPRKKDEKERIVGPSPEALLALLVRHYGYLQEQLRVVEESMGSGMRTVRTVTRTGRRAEDGTMVYDPEKTKIRVTQTPPNVSARAVKLAGRIRKDLVDLEGRIRVLREEEQKRQAARKEEKSRTSGVMKEVRVPTPRRSGGGVPPDLTEDARIAELLGVRWAQFASRRKH